MSGLAPCCVEVQYMTNCNSIAACINVCMTAQLLLQYVSLCVVGYHTVLVLCVAAKWSSEGIHMYILKES